MEQYYCEWDAVILVDLLWANLWHIPAADFKTILQLPVAQQSIFQQAQNGIHNVLNHSDFKYELLLELMYIVK